MSSALQRIISNILSTVEKVNNAAGFTISGGTSNKALVVPEDVNLGGVLRTNQLTNSQWMAMSGSSLENVGSAVQIDNCADDSTAEWYASGTLAFDTDHYHLSKGSVNAIAIRPTADNMSLTAGKLYMVGIYLKDGTASGVDIMVGAYTSGAGAGNSLMHRHVTTTGSFVSYVHIFESLGTETSVGIYITANLGGNYIEFRDFTLYEVTPGYVGITQIGPDSWAKRIGATFLYREHNGSNTKVGSFYSIKLISDTGGTDRTIMWPMESATAITSSMLERFRGRTITFGAWVKTDTASSSRLIITQTSGSTKSSFHSGGNTFEWLEVSAAIADSTSVFYVELSSEVASKTAYFSQPMLVFGSSIGAGNYQPIPNEVIPFQTRVSIYDNATISTSATLNLEALTSGKVGKGVKKIWYGLMCQSTGVGEGIALAQSSDMALYTSTFSQVATINFGKSGDTACDANGDVYLRFATANFSAVYLNITAIQT
jgi:hypothetical protein